MEEPTIRRKKTFPIQLTRLELLHLRDLFNVLLANETNQTMSQALVAAKLDHWEVVRLWQKWAAATRLTDDDAPDFAVAPSQSLSTSPFNEKESE